MPAFGSSASMQAELLVTQTDLEATAGDHQRPVLIHDLRHCFGLPPGESAHAADRWYHTAPLGVATPLHRTHSLKCKDFFSPQSNSTHCMQECTGKVKQCLHVYARYPTVLMCSRCFQALLRSLLSVELGHLTPPVGHTA